MKIHLILVLTVVCSLSVWGSSVREIHGMIVDNQVVYLDMVSVEPLVHQEPVFPAPGSPSPQMPQSNENRGSIRIYDAHGKALVWELFELYEISDGTHERVFSFIVTVPDTAHRVELYNGSTLVYTAHRKPVEPLSFEVYTQGAHLIVEQPDTHKMSSTIFILKDNTAYPVVLDAQHIQPIPLMYLPSQSFQIRVERTDLFTHQSVDSAVLDIHPQPMPVIMQPQEKSLVGQSVVLEGTLIEDIWYFTPIQSDDLMWYSSRDGFLFVGKTQSVTLSEGTHIITVHDPSSGQNSSITLYVTPHDSVVSIDSIQVASESVAGDALSVQIQTTLTGDPLQAQLQVYLGNSRVATKDVVIWTAEQFSVQLTNVPAGQHNLSVEIVGDAHIHNELGVQHITVSNNWCEGTDLNKDGVVDDTDLSIVRSNMGRSDCSQSNGWCQGADINRNGRVDLHDSMLLFNHYNTTCWGSTNNWCEGADFTRDGVVDSNDFSVFLSHFTRTDCQESNAWCASTDLDRDGRVTLYDFMLFLNQFGRTDCR